MNIKKVKKLNSNNEIYASVGPCIGEKNYEVDDFTESVDLAPTILEAAGINIPYYMQGKSLFEKM